MANEYPSWKEVSSSDAYEGKHYPRLADDMPTFLGVPHATSKDDLKEPTSLSLARPMSLAGAQILPVLARRSGWRRGKRVRQQSVRYSSYILDFDMDVFDTMKVVDYGDAVIPPRANIEATVDVILEAQAAVEAKVNDALDIGAVPIVIGQNSPCGSYAIAKPVSEHTRGQRRHGEPRRSLGLAEDGPLDHGPACRWRG